MGVALAFAALAGRELIQWPWKKEDADIIADVVFQKLLLRTLMPIAKSHIEYFTPNNNFVIIEIKAV